MKKTCKNIILNEVFIEKSIHQCFSKKWNRMDVIRLISKYSNRNIHVVRTLTKVRYINGYGYYNQRHLLINDIKCIAINLKEEICNRKIKLKPIVYYEKYDNSSKKVRVIGVESIKQQIYDYVAVNGLMELFKKKIGDNQFACVPGRGQIYGKRRIEKWIRVHPKKSQYAIKADVKKCYPSINTSILKTYLKKWVKNDDLLYLVFTLIDSYKGGLSIGSYLSTWLCNLYLSIAYHYANQKLLKERIKKDGNIINKRLIFKVGFYMDDIILIGPNKSDLKMAIRKLIIFMKNELDLIIKPNWKLFRIHNKSYKHRSQFIDIMGFKISKSYTLIRKSTFLKIRRTYIKAWKYILRYKIIPIHIAKKCVAFYGKFKHSNSIHAVKKYRIDKILKIAERCISCESKIYRTTTMCKVATIG